MFKTLVIIVVTHGWDSLFLVVASKFGLYDQAFACGGVGEEGEKGGKEKEQKRKGKTPLCTFCSAFFLFCVVGLGIRGFCFFCWFGLLVYLLITPT